MAHHLKMRIGKAGRLPGCHVKATDHADPLVLADIGGIGDIMSIMGIMDTGVGPLALVSALADHGVFLTSCWLCVQKLWKLPGSLLLPAGARLRIKSAFLSYGV